MPSSVRARKTRGRAPASSTAPNQMWWIPGLRMPASSHGRAREAGPSVEDRTAHAGTVRLGGVGARQPQRGVLGQPAKSLKRGRFERAIALLPFFTSSRPQMTTTFRSAVAIALLLLFGQSTAACWGKFNLTRKLWGFNNTASDSKWLKWLLFL